MQELRQSVALSLLLVALSAILVGCGDSNSAPVVQRPPRPVLVAPVHFTENREARTFVAQIKPRVESAHAFRISGRVVHRLVDVGDTVRAGAPLAVLDDTDLRLQLEQADAERRAATTLLAHEEGEERRFASLRNQGFTAVSTYDRQKATADEARSRLARADKAVSLAENALAYATLRAEDDGVITSVKVEPGQVVAIGDPAVTIAKAGGIEAEIAVPEALVEKARTGTATVHLWSTGDKPYAAHLRELSPLADPVTRTFAARFSIDAPDEAIRLGMSATLALAKSGERLAAIPISAVFDQGTGPSVWTVDRTNGALSLKPVAIAKYDGQSALLRSGVANGDLVVTLGVHKLDASQRVRIVNTLNR